MSRRTTVLLGFVAIALSLPAQTLSPTEVEAVVTTDLGVFRFEFAPAAAPNHVDQFLKFARQGYYDGSAFFRVIANGIIQGGDPLLKDPATQRVRWGTGGLNLLASEFSGFKHERGVVSTVSITGRPDSDGSQFFICVTPQPQLDGQYSAFGKVTEGMDVVEGISRVPADAGGVTEKPVRILSIKIEPKKLEPFLTATPEQMNKVVRLKTTAGVIRVQMEPAWAPENVRSFLKLAATGWMDGTAFHRVVKGFVAQGGMGNTRANPTHAADRWVRNVKDEFRGDVKHVRGILSMAHFDEPNSGSTSFFLMLGPATYLDGKFSAFGRVVEGMEVLDTIEKEELDGEAPKRRIEIVEAVVE